MWDSSGYEEMVAGSKVHLKNLQTNLSAIALFFAWIEMTLMLGRRPSIGKYTYMSIQVTLWEFARFDLDVSRWSTSWLSSSWFTWPPSSPLAWSSLSCWPKTRRCSTTRGPASLRSWSWWSGNTTSRTASLSRRSQMTKWWVVNWLGPRYFCSFTGGLFWCGQGLPCPRADHHDHHDVPDHHHHWQPHHWPHREQPEVVISNKTSTSLNICHPVNFTSSQTSTSLARLFNKSWVSRKQ